MPGTFFDLSPPFRSRPYLLPAPWCLLPFSKNEATSVFIGRSTPLPDNRTLLDNDQVWCAIRFPGEPGTLLSGKRGVTGENWKRAPKGKSIRPPSEFDPFSLP